MGTYIKVRSDEYLTAGYFSNRGEKMKIESLNISGIGGIKELKLGFHDGFNVICGANGVGKTTVLDIIADAFTSAKHNLL